MTTELAPSNAPMAALTARAAERYPDGIAATYRRDGEWQQVTYTELWHDVRQMAHALIGLGVQPGDRVAILCNTRIRVLDR